MRTGTVCAVAGVIVALCCTSVQGQRPPKVTIRDNVYEMKGRLVVVKPSDYLRLNLKWEWWNNPGELAPIGIQGPLLAAVVVYMIDFSEYQTGGSASQAMETLRQRFMDNVKKDFTRFSLVREGKQGYIGNRRAEYIHFTGVPYLRYKQGDKVLKRPDPRGTVMFNEVYAVVTGTRGYLVQIAYDNKIVHRSSPLARTRKARYMVWCFRQIKGRMKFS